MTQVVTLNSGESADLMLFARETREPLRYFLYQQNGPEATAPTIPEERIKLEGSRKFIIDVRYSYGKKRIKITTKMNKGFDGRLWRMTDGAGGGMF